MGNQWGDIYLCVPNQNVWGDVSSRSPPIIAAPSAHRPSATGAKNIAARFDRKSGSITEMVQDRHVVTTHHQQEVSRPIDSSHFP